MIARPRTKKHGFESVALIRFTDIVENELMCFAMSLAGSVLDVSIVLSSRSNSWERHYLAESFKEMLLYYT